MPSKNKNVNLYCSFRNDKYKICGNKSKKEANIDVAFQKAEKEGWTKVELTKKCTNYYCPKCSNLIDKLEFVVK